MTSTIEVSGAHQAFLKPACDYLRDPTVSDAEALAFLEKLCTIAFRDGVGVALNEILGDLAAVKTGIQ